ncbi:DUF2752 domain-containing protein [Nocardioides sp. MAHUQ-72]|uniref:DUF2752 domain-containing protein n=1 Tax=unclassified Nocardioides TaxID=2615069 RepID=UPI003623AC44
MTLPVMAAAAPPPLTRPGRLQRLSLPLAAGALAVAGTLALHLRDPHASGSWGFCPVALLGLSCPLCGSLRAVNDLTHLDLVAAASSNLLLVVAAPFVVALWARRLVACWRGGAAMAPLRIPRAAWVAFVAVLAVFTVARNLPVGGWLAP